MEDLKIMHSDGSNGILAYEVFESFKDKIHGQVLLSQDEGYDTARTVWNGMIDRHPACIVQAKNHEDVKACIDLAREYAILISVKGGGHNVAGNAVCEGGIMIDMSLMKEVTVDTGNRTARVQAGATWHDFDAETHKFGLATTGGVISDTGVAGLTLGGGIGWLIGKYGLASDNLICVKMITADGQYRTVSQEENPDLFWGIRGGGGNFGIVTEFEFQLHPLTNVYGGLMAYPLPMAAQLIPVYLELMKNAPDELAINIAWITSPEGHKALGFIVCYYGEDLSKGRELLEPLFQVGSPVMEHIGIIPYPVLQSVLDETYRPGLRNYWRSNFVKTLDPAIFEIILKHFADAPSPLSGIVLERFGGEVNRIDDNATAYAHRNNAFNLMAISMWDGAEKDEQNIGWLKALWEELAPYLQARVYVNYLGSEDTEGINRIKEAYGEAKYARLVELKQKYDPTNLFRMNQNIKPMK